MRGLEMQLLDDGTNWEEWDMFDTIFQFYGCTLNTHICYALGLDKDTKYTLSINFEESCFSVSDTETGKELGTGNLQIAPTKMKKSIDADQ